MRTIVCEHCDHVALFVEGSLVFYYVALNMVFKLRRQQISQVKVHHQTQIDLYFT